MTNAKQTFLTTEIGSLPHHNVDAALEHAFQVDLPFLPQLPARYTKEFMVAQTLDGLPGLLTDKDGQAQIDLEKWNNQTHTLEAKLEKALYSKEPDAFKDFEPSNEAWHAWQPFLWELEERQITKAKIELTGPLTCQWAIKDTAGRSIEENALLTSQIFKLVVVRAIAMVRKLKSQGVTPVLFLDEPALYLLDLKNPRHLLRLQELKVVIQTLKKEDVQVGLHCCSNTQWGAVLELGLDILSIDSQLSLSNLLEQRDVLQKFIKRGGTLSLGIIPTNKSGDIKDLDTPVLIQELSKALRPLELGEVYLTPACGLALHTPESAETILHTLLQCKKLLRNAQ